MGATDSLDEQNFSGLLIKNGKLGGTAAQASTPLHHKIRLVSATAGYGCAKAEQRERHIDGRQGAHHGDGCWRRARMAVSELLAEHGADRSTAPAALS